jgi:glucosylceramidase
MHFFISAYRQITAGMIVYLFLALFFSSCKEDDMPDIPDDPVVKDSINVWLTTGDKTKLLSNEGNLVMRDVPTGSWPVIVIDTSQTFQTMHGFGAALTGSSAYLINKEMTPAARQNVLEKLFSVNTGIGISYLRLTMGASDFSLSDFTYDDMPVGQTDFALEHFSLSRDLEDVVPVMQQILAIDPQISIMGSPWSPPAWMKTNGNMRGGKLKPECYSVYADYFVRYVQAMQANGITITSVTPQNEPLYFTAGYPCMEMQAAEQLGFIRGHLGPKFAAAGLSTKIIVYDHNWDVTDYAITILNDQVTNGYVAGSAFHAYAGDVTAMSTVHYAHPDKELYFTEVSGGAWATNFKDNLMWNMRNIFIGTAQNWSTTSLMWNLALDQSYGPKNNGCSNCRGVVTINTQTDQVVYNEEYYSIGHFSKFVRPGAMRIGSSRPAELSEVGVVAFQNTDGTKSLVASNYSNASKTFTVKQGEGYFNYTLPATSVVTLVWK